MYVTMDKPPANLQPYEKSFAELTKCSEVILRFFKTAHKVNKHHVSTATLHIEFLFKRYYFQVTNTDIAIYTHEYISFCYRRPLCITIVCISEKTCNTLLGDMNAPPSCVVDHIVIRVNRNGAIKSFFVIVIMDAGKNISS